MVHQGILNYLKEGKRRGFSTELLKQKLIEGGFKEFDINEAINFIERDKPMVSQPLLLQPKPLPTKNNIQNENEEKIGTFNKIGKSITRPIELFEKTLDEKVWPVLKYYLLILMIPFIAISVLAILFIDVTIYFLSFLYVPTTPWIINLLVVGLLALIFFIIIPLIMLIAVGFSHLIVKIFGGKGDYSDTLRAYVYGSTPSTLVLVVPLVNIGAAFWSFILGIIGISINHNISRLRAFLATVIPPLIVGIILLIIAIALKIHTI